MRFTLQPSIPCNRCIGSRYFDTNEAINVSLSSLDCTSNLVWAVDCSNDVNYLTLGTFEAIETQLTGHLLVYFELKLVAFLRSSCWAFELPLRALAWCAVSFILHLSLSLWRWWGREGVQQLRGKLATVLIKYLLALLCGKTWLSLILFYFISFTSNQLK